MGVSVRAIWAGFNVACLSRSANCLCDFAHYSARDVVDFYLGWFR